MKFVFPFRRICSIALALSSSFPLTNANVYAACSTSITLQADSSNPADKLQGRLIYHTYKSYGDGSSTVFMYDFKAKSLYQFNFVQWGIVDAMNAVFSPDGKRIAFMGKQGGYWHIFTWTIGSTTPPSNLSTAYGATGRNEDPKFSSDGKRIIFKHNADIYLINIAFQTNGSAVVSGAPIAITNDGWTIEDSMPYLTPSGKYAVFARGAGASFDIYRVELNSSGAPVSAPIKYMAKDGVSDYYPIPRDTSSYYFTRWQSSSSTYDQLFIKIPVTNTEFQLPINHCSSNNSDAAPVDEDMLVFSATTFTSNYSLYIGDVNTGKVWSLNKYGINNATTQKLGAMYTNAR